MTTEPRRKQGARTNARPAPCSVCGHTVKEREGTVLRTSEGTKVIHRPARWVGSPTSGGWAGGCPTDERAKSASIAELLAEMERDAELYRVLWVVAAGRNRYEDLLDLCTATAVSRATTSALIVEPLQRLEDRLSRAAEERHAFLDLGRLRRVLQEEDVCERMARAQHRDAQLVAGASELLAELVHLGDGFAQVPLVDLVGGHGRRHGVRLSFSLSGPFP